MKCWLVIMAYLVPVMLLAKPKSGLNIGGGQVWLLSEDVKEYDPCLSGVINLKLKDLIPGIGLELTGNQLKFSRSDNDTTPMDESLYELRYTPFSLCGTYDSSPLFPNRFLRLFLTAGLGFYLWENRYEGKVITLPDSLGGGEIKEQDIGFVGGIGLEFTPLRFLGLELVTRYHYIASCEFDKYGPWDKDEKLWETRIGLNFYLP